MAAPSRKPLVLVVEDDDDFRDVLTWSLEEEGCRVIAAYDGRSAFEALRRWERPDLVLLDLWMPGMDGWRFRRELDLRMPSKQPPIVVMTAAKAQSAAFLRVAEVLQKPFSASRLTHVVDKYCLAARA